MAITVRVNRGTFHPANIAGAPPWVFWTNVIVNALLAWAIGLSFLLLIPIGLFVAILSVFAALRAKGPFYLKFLIRSVFGPIRHLDV